MEAIEITSSDSEGSYGKSPEMSLCRVSLNRDSILASWSSCLVSHAYKRQWWAPN